MMPARVCVTAYKGPTDHQGSRVVARHVTTRKRKVLPWDHALDAQANHAAAARIVLGCEPEWYASVEGGGYIFGAFPK